MQYVKCNLCGADDYVVVFAPGLAQPNRIVRCKACGLMYGNPRLSNVDCECVKGHDPAFLDTLMQRHDPRRGKEEQQVVDFAPTREALAKAYPQRGKLLEIGCSYGFLSKYFRDDGWDTTGLEPDPIPARHAREVLGLRVVDAVPSQARLPAASFDVVLMMHVIEHAPDPREMLAEIHRVLKPGGTLVMETPRFDSLAFRLLRHRERSIACEGHVYFFTTRTLGALARDAHFEVDRLDLVGRSMTLERLLWNVGVVSKSRRLMDWIQRASRRLGLERWRVKLNARDMQRLYARKI